MIDKSIMPNRGMIHIDQNDTKSIQNTIGDNFLTQRIQIDSSRKTLTNNNDSR